MTIIKETLKCTLALFLMVIFMYFSGIVFAPLLIATVFQIFNPYVAIFLVVLLIALVHLPYYNWFYKTSYSLFALPISHILFPVIVSATIICIYKLIYLISPNKLDTSAFLIFVIIIYAFIAYYLPAAIITFIISFKLKKQSVSAETKL